MSRTVAPLRSAGGLALRLARQWWPQVAALAAACAVVATTIAGALSVGDAMRSGLRRLALERLGRIDAALLAEEFFTPDLLAGAAPSDAGRLVPAIVMPALAARADGTATRITLLACDDPAALGFDPPPPPLAPGGVTVNHVLAAALGLAADDALVVRLPERSGVPADNPLGRRGGESSGRRLTVSAILPPRGIGQFSLRPVQATAPLAITSLLEARRIIGRATAVNAIFAVDTPPGSDPARALRTRLTPGLADYGLSLEAASSQPASLRLTSRRLILPAAIDEAAIRILAPLGGTPTLAFLANAILPADGGGRIPYSTVLGIAGTRLPVGDLVDDRGEVLEPPGDDGIIVDRWVADDLAAQGRPVRVGDMLRLEFFEPETIHGRVVETSAELRISGIAAMRGAATARGVMPEVEGITDEASIADWDPPFPFDSARVRTTPPHDEDDRYWKAHGPTPKAFVSLATARRLAAGRFGGTTAWLVPTAAVGDGDSISRRIAAAIPPERAGLTVVPLRAEALAAARGSTPFGGLLLALSSFVVIAGLLLVWLLFGLLVAARGRDLGTLCAVGFAPRRLTAVLVAVGGLAALAGAAVGGLLGRPWSTALLGMLGRRWARDVAAGAAGVFEAASPALTPAIEGAAAAGGLALAALAWAAARAARRPPLELLRGGGPSPHRGPRRRGWITLAVGLTCAAVAAALGRNASPQGMVGLFFTAGFASLATLLAMVRLGLTARPRAAARTLFGLAVRDLGFAPGRAFSVAAIVAAATFLIVAVSAFGQRPPADPTDPASPSGGWSEIVSFGAPTGVDPTAAEARSRLGLSSTQEAIVAECRITRLRASVGDDAACTNLYAALRPTVVGVGPDFVARGGFTFLGHESRSADNAGNPWTLLAEPVDGGPVPAILDQATAQWGLKVGGVGAEFTLPDDAGRAVSFRIVGLLEPGILQGLVIVSEEAFERIFPDRSGYGMALVDASDVPAARRAEVAPALAAAWSDAAAAVEPAAARLASLQAVQNTFLAGFQSLGVLGLLLGTAGVAAVQVQGTLERLGPLSVLRAMGFTLARVRLLLTLETLIMVGLGLVAGTAAALVAVAPALASGQARPPLAWIAVACGLSLAAAVVAATLAATRAAIPTRPIAD